MNSNFQIIKDAINTSDIPEDEKVELIAMFARANNEELDETAKLFSQDSSWIQQVNDNYKAKRVAMILGEESLWEKIIKEEESFLSKIQE